MSTMYIFTIVPFCFVIVLPRPRTALFKKSFCDLECEILNNDKNKKFACRTHTLI